MNTRLAILISTTAVVFPCLAAEPTQPTTTVQRVNIPFDQVYRRRVAYCVGIDQYNAFPRLECAVKDAETMAGVFKAHGFDDVTLLTNDQAKRKTIINELLRFKGEADTDDLFVLYFAGHGQTVKQKNGDEMGYLVPIDCKPGQEEDNGISMGILKDIADTMPNRHVLFLVDCCYSGYGLARSSRGIKVMANSPTQTERNEYLRGLLSRKSVQIVTAGGKEDQAEEAGGHGVFTRHVLECLRGETLDKEDGVVTAMELAARVKQQVVNDTKGRQNPNFGYLCGDGDVVFVMGQEKRRGVVTAVENEPPERVMERLSLEYKEVERLEKAGEFEKAERKMSRLYGEFKTLPPQAGETGIEYLRMLDRVLLNMEKNDLALYYANTLAETANSDIDRALGYNNIGMAYHSKGQYDKAIEYHEKALAIKLKALGPEHPDVAASYSNIGVAYGYKGQYDKAIEYYEKALAILLKVLGPEHPNVAINYSNIGIAYDSKGQYDKAIEYHEKALGIRLKALGSEHPAVASSYNNIAAVQYKQKRYDDAETSMLKALSIRRRTLGAEHPDTKASEKSLAAIRQALSK